VQGAGAAARAEAKSFALLANAQPRNADPRDPAPTMPPTPTSSPSCESPGALRTASAGATLAPVGYFSYSYADLNLPEEQLDKLKKSFLASLLAAPPVPKSLTTKSGADRLVASEEVVSPSASTMDPLMRHDHIRKRRSPHASCSTLICAAQNAVNHARIGFPALCRRTAVLLERRAIERSPPAR